jgi:hypothetical protein
VSTATIVAAFARGSLDDAGPLVATVTAQACDEHICLPPADISAPVN